MRAHVIFIVVAAFAGCEMQRLELVPEEGSAVEDSGASGGATATGGRPSNGGSSARGGSVHGGGSFGAGGGPGIGGFSPGTGGAGFTGVSCKGIRDCGGRGECVNSECVACGGTAGCKDGQVCNLFTGRCVPYCDGPDDCAEPFITQCDVEQHVCVECIGDGQCEVMSKTKRFCVRLVGVCVECFGDTDCGNGNRCDGRGDCKCVDDTGCDPDRCDPDSHECVRRN
jgi:hypothetical protein